MALKFIFLPSILFKKDESTSQEKIVDQEDQNETSFLPTENLERQKTEGCMITLPILIFLIYLTIILELVSSKYDIAEVVAFPSAKL